MPLDLPHPDYDAFYKAWTRARDVLAGEDAVKAAGTRYLPRLDFQSEADYEAYKARAAFFNATARTSEGYLGLIFRRPAFIKLPESPPALAQAFADFARDADLLGTSLNAYAKNVVNEVVAVSRCGSLLDWEDNEQRVYTTLYRAEQILNWHVQRIRGRNTPVLIVLQESTPATQSPDPYKPEIRDQLRVLRLVDASSISIQPHPTSAKPLDAHQLSAIIYQPTNAQRLDAHQPSPVNHHLSARSSANHHSAQPLDAHQPSTLNHQLSPRAECAYIVELWQKSDSSSSQSKQDWILMETRVPRRLGKFIPFIPFVFHGPKHSLPAPEKLPLADIIAVNLDHYRLDADYKHGIHFTALPTAWVSGFEKGSPLRIGSSTAWVTETTGAAAGFLEFKGQGLETFERAMDRDERLMAILGSRLLEGQKKVGEAAQAIELRQSGENSILSSLAFSVSQSLTQILQWVFWWNSVEEKPDDIGPDRVLLELNTDFSTKGMDPQEIQAIVAAWQAGAISRETMTDLFRRGEVLPEGRTAEEELHAIKSAAAPSPTTTDD